MINEWPVFKRFQIEKIYNKFNEKEKRFLNDYLQFRRARGVTTERKILDIRRHIIQIIYALGKDYDTLSSPVKTNEPLKILRNFLSLINSAKLSNIVKNDMKCDFRSFLKEKYPDWSARFANFEDVKLVSSVNEQRINSKNLYSKSDIEKLVKSEHKFYWKAFLLVQYEGGLRTKEVRMLKWEDMKFNVDGDISEINIYATKTKKARPVFVKEATFYLKKLKEEQENLEKKGVYVFNSRKDINQPVCKTNVSVWFRELTKRTLGRVGWNYLLRHSRATELYKLARENKIARDTATQFMGHSKDMSYIYEHLDKSKIKEMLKNQVYNLEDLPPETKAELEKEVDDLQEQVKSLKDTDHLFAEKMAKFLEVFKSNPKLAKEAAKVMKGKEIF